jgi:hypothetical protein
MNHVIIPNFLVIGCQRCGTTWLDAALREHPQVFLPTQKQSYYFDRNYEKPISEYFANFLNAVPKKHVAIGEVATGYCLPEAIPRMHEALPNARLIMLMRNPIERAFSNYLIRQDEEGWTDFMDAIENSKDIIERGMYFKQIEVLLKYYTKNSILFLLYDDLNLSNENTIKKIYKFLGVNYDFKPSIIGKRKNSALFPRFRKFLHKIGLKVFLNYLSQTFIGTIIRKLAMQFKSRGSAASIDLKTKNKLLNIYKDSNQKLLVFLNRDRDLWD